MPHLGNEVLASSMLGGVCALVRTTAAMNSTLRLLTAACLAAALLSGCSCGGPTPPDPTPDGSVDAGGGDGGSSPDGGGGGDGGTTDGGPQELPTDPRNTNNPILDTDCDGLSDAQEFANVYAGNLRTNPGLADTDGDGIPDGVEAGLTSSQSPDSGCTFTADQDPASRTHPVRADTDGDGLMDGVEDTNRNGRVDVDETNPQGEDTDGDGLKDGEEDANRNGRVDVGETDPRLRDTDGDGISDRDELLVTRTDPLLSDTDTDTCADGVEDLNRNGVVDPGETDPRNATDCGPGRVSDTDGDGLSDTLEDTTGTDKTKTDTDEDGILDGVEDKNRNGRVDSGETNPRKRDSDCDGLVDGPDRTPLRGEDLNANGRVDSGETDPTNPDSDRDGIVDGVERGIASASAPDTTCGYVGDADPATTTDPARADSDNDGIADGAEDTNQNGRVDPGELDPNNGQDGAPDTPPGQACSAQNLRQVSLRESNGADMRLALRPSFQEVSAILIGQETGRERGFIGYDDANKVAFIAYKRGQVGSATSVVDDEAGIRAQFNPAVTLDTTQTFTTWDGYPALSAFYTQSATSDLKAYANQLAETLVGTGAGRLAGTSNVTGPFKIQAQYVHRSNSSVLVVLAITPTARFIEPGIFVTGDTAGGTALAQFGDADAVQCETFTTQGGAVDFLFVVDDSCSMESSQTALAQAANAVAQRLSNSSLDWRLGLVSTAYSLSPNNQFNGQTPRGFTRNIDQFRAWLTEESKCGSNGQCTNITQATTCNPSQNNRDGYNPNCWITVSGSGTERALESARMAVNDAHSGGLSATYPDFRLRSSAELVVVILTDTRDQSSGAVSDYISYFRNTGTNTGVNKNPHDRPITVHGIICPPDGSRCQSAEDNTNPRHLDVIQATGGVYGSIRSQSAIQTTIYTIVDSVIASSGYRTLKPPIGASVRVAVEAVVDPASCPTTGDIPRSRVNGFDIDGLSRALSFYGACRPANPGTTSSAVSYRYWVDRSTDADGSAPPCSSDTTYYTPNEPDYCVGRLVCNRATDTCECPFDCGGGGLPTQICNTDRAVCNFTCPADCNGACGTYETCDTSTCSCQCQQSASCAPGFRFDTGVCGCVCDTGAINCGPTYTADVNACACVCRPDCGGCTGNTRCNPSTCACEGILR